MEVGRKIFTKIIPKIPIEAVWKPVPLLSVTIILSPDTIKHAQQELSLPTASNKDNCQQIAQAVAEGKKMIKELTVIRTLSNLICISLINMAINS